MSSPYQHPPLPPHAPTTSPTPAGSVAEGSLRTARRRERAGATAWDEIRGFVDRQDASAVAARVVELDEAARKEVARRLPGYLKVLRDRHESWEGVGDYAAVLRAAGAGVLPGAAAVATWLNRRDFASRWGAPYEDTDRIMAILATRPPEWRAELARRLVLRLRTGEDRGVELALALLRTTGIEAPIHDPLVVGWLETAGRRPVPSEDPLFDLMLPRIFDAQGVGRALQWESGPTGPWLKALCDLAAGDAAKRPTLLEGCVRRFLLGGSALDLRFFARLHEALDPAPHEIEPRAHDYLRLLPAAPGPVAELALRRLRRLDGLDPADLAEAWEALFFRPERKLVRAGLTWLDQLVRLSPELAGSIAGPLALAFAADSAELQEKAVTLAIKHAGRMGDEGRAAVGDALGLLPPDLGRRVHAVFGGVEPAGPDPDPQDGFAPPPLPRPDGPRRMPDPIGSVAETLPLLDGSAGWQAWERLLAGFVALVHQDREGTATALKPGLAGRYEHLYGGGDRWHRIDRWNQVDHWLIGAACSLTGIAPVRSVWKDRLPDARHLCPPDLLLLHRAAEIQMAVEEDVVPPLLLSTPTLTTGHVEASELVTRMEIIEAAGAKPLAADLQQALLRLPGERDPEAAGRAGRLSSPAGRLVARWLAGARLADPVVEVRWSYGEYGERKWFEDGEPDVFPGVKLVPSLHAPATGLPLVDRVFGDPRSSSGVHPAWWPSMFPSHREVAAAHLLPHLLHGEWDEPKVRVSHLHRLARLDGPPGVAVSLVLARLLGNPDMPEAVDALLAMAGRGDLPAAELGRQAALLVGRDQMRLRHLTAALESASRQGAHQEVWTAVAAALPSLVPRPGRRPHHGSAEFLALGATAAAWCRARGAIPEVEAVAARKGSSNLLREARRLHELLTAKEG
ncbi:hypothetical protein [Streptosporangium sp. NBC_01756]|uniref:hypothetical protein n=1 Tax=Streptosporangium sp. NBC_01756 TaxID=2975950 RepID=UPI002DD8228D|nr:hypothetical protein [Streptosporangium sp. NBC_01756]WSC84653.1 DUF6493 family protein [Streptosporangium sp. NBC_01756]